MSVITKAMFALGLLALPSLAAAGDGRIDLLEDRLDAAENAYDAATDNGRADLAEDRIDLAEDSADAAGVDRHDAIDRHERRAWRRILRGGGDGTAD